MSTPLRSIWLGDVVRALVGLGGFDSDERFRSIVDRLGFVEQARSQLAPEPTRPVDGAASGSPEPQRAPLAPRRPDPMPVTTVDQLSPVRSDRLAMSDLDGPVLALPEPASRAALALDPLLPPQTAASLLRLLLSRRPRDGEVDMPELVDRLSRAEGIEDLPRLPQRTLRFGTQLMLDIGDGMAVFRRDQVHLTSIVRAVVGAGLTSVQYFADAPTRRCGPGPRSTWGPFRSPPPGTRVLIVSDFGIGGPAAHGRRATMSEWAAAVALLRRSRCEAVALVPYRRARWPAGLADLVPAVTWDRGLASGVADVAGR